MSALVETNFAQNPSAPFSAAPQLREMPRLLEYRADADPDAAFIPKTVAGFAGGAIAMGICLDLGEALFLHPQMGVIIPTGILTRFAVMVGLTFVATSLLLVGLKVRADHSAVALFARHWLNSISTGAVYALLVWGPWVLMTHQILINRYVASIIWMALMAFPAIAARWTIGPHPSTAARQ